ncbi:MAG: hypothetical protein ALECFALPRED_005796 [Alectoria fallacina]|uniref:Uncharacterized protein n=1 Tax=Alectoria fallacina TaxID=1903189 RepID=A0A8H3IYG0_9LECA|nr:MAG: hypothetical protein ALECFALPRED_005796 [Alectoria fallacina]
MSKGEGGGDIAAMVNEREGRDAVLSMANDGIGKAVPPPAGNEAHRMDHSSPVMSYEKGTGHIEPTIDEGEIRLAGQGKGNSSHLQAPTTRPVSQAQADPAPGTAQSIPKDDQAQSTFLPKNSLLEYECGCAMIYDDSSKNRQNACDLHRLNPNRSVLPLPPKTPLSEVTNLTGSAPRRRVYTPLAERIEDSPVVTPIKPFNFEQAIKPTGPSNTLTTIPTQEDTYLKVPNPQRTRIPRQVDEGAVGSQGIQPQQLNAMEGQDPEEPRDISGGPELFRKAVERLRAGEGKMAANNGSGPAGEDQGGASIPTLMLETDAGPVGARTNSKDEPVFTVTAMPRDGGDEGKSCKYCVLM